MENTPAGPLSFLQAKGPLSQIILAVVISTILYIVLTSLEAIYVSYMQVAHTRVDIEGEGRTMTSGKSVTYTTNSQKSDTDKDAVVKYRDLRFSTNEKTGIEYSYSCFLNIDKKTFTEGSSDLCHIFHKGTNPNKGAYPLLSPGVFVLSNTNTLRVFQNVSTTWYNYIDIPNIPINKWFHLVVLAKNNAIEVFINGNLAAKLSSQGGVIYQNYQNLYIFGEDFPTNNINTGKTMASIRDPKDPLSENERFSVLKSMEGSISQFFYFSYALSYTEIQDMMNMGPNPVIVLNNSDKPPYFMDNWWTGTQNLM